MNTKKVLVVDDEFSYREPIVYILEDSGYLVVSASSGIEALELIKGDLPDLVLTDVRMPRMDGITLLEKIKKDHPDIPVLLMSAYGIGDKTMKYKSTCFFNKPMDLTEISMKVDYALSLGNL